RDGQELVIRNAAGEELRGEAGSEGISSEHPHGQHPYVRALLQDAAMAMGLAA
ncbi:MAG: single-stranded-DNA-specific exonuclease RecJ, partial [Cyanobacteriota bacterium]